MCDPRPLVLDSVRISQFYELSTIGRPIFWRFVLDILKFDRQAVMDDGFQGLLGFLRYENPLTSEGADELLFLSRFLSTLSSFC